MVTTRISRAPIRHSPFCASAAGAIANRSITTATAARRIERAVSECLGANECTRDLGGDLGTAATGDAVVRRL